MKLFGAGRHARGSIGQARRRMNNARDRASGKVADERNNEQNLFHRNRTLAGNVSSRVLSTAKLKDNLPSSRTHVHQLAAHRRMIIKILLFVVAVSCFLIWVLYNFTAKIDVSATDNISIDEGRYINVMNDYFNARPLERFRFAFNSEAASKYFEQAVPEVISVEMGGTSGFASTHFDLLFRQPVASWRIAQTQYYVDQDGVSFNKNYFDKPIVRIVDNSGVPQSVGTTIASGRFLRFVGRTVTVARASNLIIEEAVIPVGTTHQVEVLIKGHKYPIKMSLDRPVGEQVEDMQNAIKYFVKHHITPRYIDVRVSGVAYYR